ncbi:STAS domain-containing protein [Actinomycetospora cinnamomea]|uniref:STAS domain-containing protein n=1 Tax=Actinomycetospora cinnamomea TaxID=663609 RepID=A0A2U1FA93_9PSEU|nr:STAS domain-containing protein [Actinomycetospora cinnamomea]PVZ08890.1 STAS domain-containing protein [Actinomycetospora cinnamomea]
MTPLLHARPDPASATSAHTLLVADAVDQGRRGTASWVERELARGSKVYYKGWLPDGRRPDQHWIAGPAGARGAREALASGQLEFLDFPAVVERCGITADGVLGLYREEIERALDGQWPTVAMTQESPALPMADGADLVGEYAAWESGFDAFTQRWPVRLLCQLTVPDENETAVWETVAVHHRAVLDGAWSAVGDVCWWRPRGDLDAHVARRFGAAVHGALRAARGSGDGPDLHLDLSEVDFMDVACAQILMLAARSAPEDQHVVLHGGPRFLRRLFDAVGRPASVREGGDAP